MANINGTNLAAPIVPFTTDDTYPTHYAKYGKGGHRTVATITERDGIFTALREEGMEVYVLETSKKYTLVGGLLNTNWVESTSIIPGLNGELFYNVQGAIGTNSNLTYNSISGTLNAGNSLYSLNSSYFIHKAGNRSLTGVFNTGISSGCLASLNDGTENTGVGINALTSLVHGNGCVALGTKALKNVEGNFNFALGYKSGELLPSGDFNLFLGAYSGFKEDSTVSNKLIIETTQGRNNSKDYLIEGDFSQRWVRFNGAVRKRVVNITSVSSINNGTATSATTNSITDTSKTFTANEFQNKFLVITGGVGVGQAMLITSNTATTITTTKNFIVTPDNTSTYKIINGATVLGEKLNSEYYFDLTTEDYVVVLPVISSSDFSGSSIDFCIKTNPNNNKLYVLTTSTNKIFPDNVETTCIQTPYTVSSFIMSNVFWNKTIKNIQSLQPIKTSTKDLVIDLYSKIYKIDIAAPTTVTLNIDSSYVPILTDNSLTIELDINMTVVSAITWPVNVTWIGGSAPTFGAIAKYRLVFRTEDAGTTWIGNLEYTSTDSGTSKEGSIAITKIDNIPPILLTVNSGILPVISGNNMSGLTFESTIGTNNEYVGKACIIRYSKNGAPYLTDVVKIVSNTSNSLIFSRDTFDYFQSTPVISVARINLYIINYSQNVDYNIYYYNTPRSSISYVVSLPSGKTNYRIELPPKANYTLMSMDNTKIMFYSDYDSGLYYEGIESSYDSAGISTYVCKEYIGGEYIWVIYASRPA